MSCDCMYADDYMLYYSSGTTDDIADMLNEELEKVDDWVCKHNLVLK